MRQKNSFRFKQFSVDQTNAAFKVGTDGCLLAAWVGNKKLSPESILDIGTGSGVIALMLAQSFPNARLKGIEQDEASAKQAAQNFSQSPWSERLNAHHSSIQDFAATTSEKFDLIVCNPPFFSQSTQNQDERKNNARHESSLQIAELLALSEQLLSDEGMLAFILPIGRRPAIEVLIAQSGMNETQLTYLRPRPEKEVHRFMTCLSKRPSNLESETWSIHKQVDEYSDQSLALLSPFYLNL